MSYVISFHNSRAHFMLLNPFTYHSPKSVKEAAQLQAELNNVRLQAGGTFLLNNLKMLKRKNLKTPEHIISLKKIQELKGVFQKKDKLIIRAMATMSDLADAPLDGNLNILKKTARGIGSTQIRNMATIGGNLTCRYTWTEMPAVLTGLEADLHFTDRNGKEVVLSAEEFFQSKAKTEQILTQISLRKNPRAVILYERVKRSADLDIPLFAVFIKTEPKGKKLTNTRVTVNNGLAFAQRDRKLEDFLNQTGRTKTLAEEALTHWDAPIYDTRSSDYKKHMFRVTIKKAIRKIIEK